MFNDVDMKNVDLQTIQRLKSEAADKLAHLDRERAAVEQWVSELTVTERTLARVLSVDLPEPQEDVPVAGQRSSGKPRGIPSIYIMAATLLRDASEPWMEGQEIVKAIRDRWWPTAETNDIAPTLWRLAKHGKLRKEATRYALPYSEGIMQGKVTAGELLQDMGNKITRQLEVK